MGDSQRTRCSGDRSNDFSRMAIIGYILAFLLICGTYVVYYVCPGGGHTYISVDGRNNYVHMFDSVHILTSAWPPAPYGTRVLQPFLALIVSALAHVSKFGAYKITVPIELAASLLLLGRIIRRRNRSHVWLISILVGIGLPLAVFYGSSDVQVDPLLLLMSCAVLDALDVGQIGWGLVFACLGVLTKEYGIFLGLAWGAYAARRHVRYAILIGLSAVVIPILVTFLALPRATAGLFAHSSRHSAGTFLFLLTYPIRSFEDAGPTVWLTQSYKSAWFVLWPAIVLAAAFAFSIARGRGEVSGKRIAQGQAVPSTTDGSQPEAVRRSSVNLQTDCIVFGWVALSTPLLLLGGWERSFLLLFPFAIAVCSWHPLSRDRLFAALIGIGGASIALERPLGSIDAPHHHPLQSLFIVVNFAATLALLIRAIQVRARRDTLRGRDPESN